MKKKELRQLPEVELKAENSTLEILRTYKFRLYPKKEQIERLEQVLWICQQLYNAGLQQWKDTYRLWKQSNLGIGYTLHENGVAIIELDRSDPGLVVQRKPPQINYYSQSRELTHLKNDIPELKQVSDKILRNVLMRVEKTCQDFHRRVKKGEKPGYPRYKSWNRYDSFTYPAAAAPESEGLEKAPGWNLKNNKLTLQMGAGTEPIGPIKIKLHRPAFGKVRTLTISRKGDEWYACFCVSQKKILENKITNPNQVTSPVGISLGLETYATLSNGEAIENPRFYERNKEQIIKAQQSLDRKNEQKKKKHTKETKNNCRNLKKARLKLSKVHRHTANQRLDFLHKLSRKLANRFDGIVFPDLDIKAMVKRPAAEVDAEKSQAQGQTIYAPNGQTKEAGYNRAILDAGWGTLILLTTYKAEEAGRLCVKLNPKYASQTCCYCDWKAQQPLDISQREFICEKCELKIYRNHNTALNLLKKQFGANCADIAVLREQLCLQEINSSINFNATG